jgi:hypothetical protein
MGSDSSLKLRKIDGNAKNVGKLYVFIEKLVSIVEKYGNSFHLFAI